MTPGEATMRTHFRLIALFVAATALALGACSGDDGKDGTDGTAGAPGTPGVNGINCWDLNQNGVADIDSEDIDKNGVVDVDDCRAPAGAYDPAGLHKGYFTEHAYTGTEQCLDCHGKIGDDVMTTGHWKWQGVSSNITGFEAEEHGKADLINNFCQAVPSNEGRCTQCHIGIGWKDKNFDFGNPKNLDCLACHDQTGTYKKAPTTAGAPDPTVDLQAVAKSVGTNAGVPPRSTCVFCHSRAGGDDNVKHGDISTDMIATTREYDVHMGTDGANMTCVACHQVKKDAEGNTLSHGIGGMAFHSVDEGVMKDCADCHGAATSIHAGTTVQSIVQSHDRLACQVCHIPTIARKVSTVVDWRWEQAGAGTAPATCAPADPAVLPNRSSYSKQKGCFVWQNNVRPVLRYFDGKWNRMMINTNDGYTSLPVDLASPTATYRTAGAMIYPFKLMVGNQPADKNFKAGKNTKTVLVPNLFGNATTDADAYWVSFDWARALASGAAYTQQEYSGEYEFVDTEMLLKVDHEVAPKEQAYGFGNVCTGCHAQGQIDWPALGWPSDPIFGDVTRPQ
jgi:octaheme c-type cytochrome (tetrathionate reductase family)